MVQSSAVPSQPAGQPELQKSKLHFSITTAPKEQHQTQLEPQRSQAETPKSDMLPIPATKIRSSSPAYVPQQSQPQLKVQQAPQVQTLQPPQPQQPQQPQQPLQPQQLSPSTPSGGIKFSVVRKVQPDKV